MLDNMVERPRVVRRLEVITGACGRRRWSADEKARILDEVLAPGRGGVGGGAPARDDAAAPVHLAPAGAGVPWPNRPGRPRSPLCRP
jgi:hypothetical protein